MIQVNIGSTGVLLAAVQGSLACHVSLSLFSFSCAVHLDRLCQSILPNEWSFRGPYWTRLCCSYDVESKTP